VAGWAAASVKLPASSADMQVREHQASARRHGGSMGETGPERSRRTGLPLVQGTGPRAAADVLW